MHLRRCERSFQFAMPLAAIVFTRAKIYGGERYLKNHLSANDYYAEGEKVVGRWVGRGAESLGLLGEVDAKGFEALRENQRPDNGDV